MVGLLLITALGFHFPLSGRRRRQMTLLTAALIALILFLPEAQRLGFPRALSALRDWLPVLPIILGYHESGWMTFPRADRRWERVFLAWDDAIIRKAPFRFLRRPLPTWLDAVLEISYLQCYPIVLSGVLALYLARQGQWADQYWSVVLPAIFACYVLTPFFPAQPPRKMLGRRDELRESLSVRRLNLRVLDWGSIQVNTFPSAHVAGAMAMSFAMMAHLPAVGIFYLAVAVGIALGAVRGGYHYAGDAAFGVIVAALAFVAAVAR